MINGINLHTCLVNILRACSFCFLLTIAGTGLAVDAQDNPGSALPDIRLVIDISGSMKQNDPDNLRQPAVELLLQLLPAGSKAGIWTFGQQVNMLVPHKPVTAQWRQEAGTRTSGIQSVGLYTNIGEALEKAAYDRDRKDSRYRTSIILLTDGMVDIDRETEVNQLERRRIVEEVLPAIADAGYRIHTVALSDNADRELMDKLSVATDGIAATAHSPDDLMRIFLKAFDAAAPSEQVPLEGSRFLIDSSIREFTALVFHEGGTQSTTLTGPDKRTYRAGVTGDNIKWYHSEDYDLITVAQPLEGEWRIDTPSDRLDPESRVTVISNLNLRVAPMPHNLFVGDGGTLIFQLDEKGKTITRPEFLSLLTSNVELVGGKKQDSIWQNDSRASTPPADGIYEVSLPPFESAGSHQLTLLIDGKSFTRKFTHSFNVHPQIAPPEVVMEPVEVPDVDIKAGPEPAPLKMEEEKEPVIDIPTAVVADDTPRQGVPSWLVYVAIALVNIAVLAGAFFAYRLIMNDGRGNKNDADESTDEGDDQNTEEAEMVSESLDDKTGKEEPEDEEPPMDDLDSAINELSQFPEATNGEGLGKKS